MDFSSLNPTNSNSLNIAARHDDTQAVRSLLKKINPNCVDNRGWTCLHEAAAHDSYESLIIILNHPNTRRLTETHEGHTALYVACRRNVSLRTIEALLKKIPGIANYGSTECVTPLHVACGQGNIEMMQLLIDYDAMLDVTDFDGDTPLHDATMGVHHECVDALLHAGADSGISNEGLYTAFHIACYKGCLKTLSSLYLFVADINQLTLKGDSALMLATQGGHIKIVKFLLRNGADPNIMNEDGFTALDMALKHGYTKIFCTLLSVTDISNIDQNIVLEACKPHYFKLGILHALLHYDLGPEFFDFHEQFYIQFEEYLTLPAPMYELNAPLNPFLGICDYIDFQSPESLTTLFYLFLMRGVSVNALDITECPPIIFLHYCPHTCFEKVFNILIEHGCNVDYFYKSTDEMHQNIPYVFITSLNCDAATSLIMLPYSLYCDPDCLLLLAERVGLLTRISIQVQTELLSLIDNELTSVENLKYHVSPLKHLSRKSVRGALKSAGVRTTTQFLNVLERLPIPSVLKKYLRYYNI